MTLQDDIFPSAISIPFMLICFTVVFVFESRLIATLLITALVFICSYHIADIQDLNNPWQHVYTYSSLNVLCCKTTKSSTKYISGY